MADVINFENLFTWVARALVMFTAMPIHECAHGFAAHKLGDDTPRNQGRLTLNPFAHLELFGSLLLVFTGFGWAKPVQVDPRNFRYPKWGMALTALAGPVSNIFMALVCMICYKLLGNALPSLRYSGGIMLEAIFTLLWVMIVTNLRLAIFNLLPVPPLDGAKIFGAILPNKFYFTVMRHERHIALGLMVILLFTNLLNWPLLFLTQWLLYLLDWITLPLGSVV